MEVENRDNDEVRYVSSNYEQQLKMLFNPLTLIDTSKIGCWKRIICFFSKASKILLNNYFPASVCNFLGI